MQTSRLGGMTAARPALAASRARHVSRVPLTRSKRGPVTTRAVSTNTYSDTNANTYTNTAARVVVSETRSGVVQYSFAGALPSSGGDYADFNTQIQVRACVCLRACTRPCVGRGAEASGNE
jgi:hypothetical protein